MVKARPNPTRPKPSFGTPPANSWLVSICHEIIRIPWRCDGAISLAVSIFNAGENKVLGSACIQPICCWWSNGFMRLLLMSSPLMPIKTRARCCFTKARIPFKVHHKGVRSRVRVHTPRKMKSFETFPGLACWNCSGSIPYQNCSTAIFLISFFSPLRLTSSIFRPFLVCAE